MCDVDCQTLKRGRSSRGPSSDAADPRAESDHCAGNELNEPLALTDGDALDLLACQFLLHPLVSALRCLFFTGTLTILSL